ncbi:MAG: putative metallopeptidase [Ignisphaera sp.]
MGLRGGRIIYTYADDVKDLVEDIVKSLWDFFWYIDCSRLYVVRSKNSKSTAVARIHALPKIWQYTLNSSPQYIIEVISEKFDSLNFEEKAYVIIHELLHIPKSFGGGLRPHKGYVSNSKIRKLLKIYLARKNYDGKNS